MTPDVYAAMSENPEYQQTIQKLMQAHPAIKAVVNLRPADEAFMGNVLQNQLNLDKLALAKKTFADTYSLESGLGLQNLKTRMNTSINSARGQLDLEKSQADWSKGLGMINAGVAAYGAESNMGLRNKLIQHYLNKG